MKKLEILKTNWQRIPTDAFGVVACTPARPGRLPNPGGTVGGLQAGSQSNLRPRGPEPTQRARWDPPGPGGGGGSRGRPLR